MVVGSVIVDNVSMLKVFKYGCSVPSLVSVYLLLLYISGNTVVVWLVVECRCGCW